MSLKNTASKLFLHKSSS